MTKLNKVAYMNNIALLHRMRVVVFLMPVLLHLVPRLISLLLFPAYRTITTLSYLTLDYPIPQIPLYPAYPSHAPTF